MKNPKKTSLKKNLAKVAVKTNNPAYAAILGLSWKEMVNASK